MRDLTTVLADWREKAQVLHATGHQNDARLIGQILDDVAESTEEWRRFIPEGEARLRSGRSVEWLRARFGEWQRQGHAEKRGRVRYYRSCVIERRADLVAARDEGLRGDTGSGRQAS